MLLKDFLFVTTNVIGTVNIDSFMRMIIYLYLYRLLFLDWFACKIMLINYVNVNCYVNN